MSKSEAIDPRIVAILLRTRLRRPYLGHALAGLTPVPRENFGTVGVDEHWRMYYDIEWLETLTPDQQCAVIEHEIWHLLRDHHARAKRIDAVQMAWNLAGDAEINDDVEDLPSSCVTPSKLGCRDADLAEVYYRHVMEQQKKTPRKGMCGGGSGAGRPLPDELPGDAKGVPALPAAAVTSIKQATAAAIMATPPGDIAAGLRVWADEQVAPVHRDWREVLSAALSARSREVSRGCQDYSWGKMARRTLAASARSRDIILRPGTVAHKPRVVLCVDTSGSMTYDERVAYALGTVHDLLQRVGPLTIIAGDTEVATHQRRVRSLSAIKWAGGGGTDMSTLIAAADGEGDIIVLVSDCETPWPSRAPTHPLTIVNVGREGVSRPSFPHIWIDVRDGDEA